MNKCKCLNQTFFSLDETAENYSEKFSHMDVWIYYDKRIIVTRFISRWNDVYNVEHIDKF